MIFQPAVNLPKVIAHRGVSASAPENTLASLYKVAEVGAAWVEFDVMLTCDGVPIIIHDETLCRTTTGTGLVSQTKYDEIAKLDAGTWFSPDFAGEKIPTLDEYLEIANQLGLGVNLEIKATAGTAYETGKAVLESIEKHWHSDKRDFLISSHCVESLTAFHSFETTLPLALVLAAWRPDWKDLVSSLDCISLNIHHSMLTADTVSEVKACAEHLLVYTVNDIETGKRCFDLGVDGIFSDCPEIF